MERRARGADEVSRHTRAATPSVARRRAKDPSPPLPDSGPFLLGIVGDRGKDSRYRARSRWQEDCHQASSAIARPHPHVPSMSLGDGLHDRQPKAGAALQIVTVAEPRACILEHADLDTVGVTARCDRDVALLGRVPDRVVHQIRDGLADLVGSICAFGPAAASTSSETPRSSARGWKPSATRLSNAPISTASLRMGRAPPRRRERTSRSSARRTRESTSLAQLCSAAWSSSCVRRAL